MTCRSAILIDNFLTQDKFDEISSLVANSPYYTGGQFEEPRDELCSKIRDLVLERLQEIGLYQPHFQEAAKLFGYNDADLPRFNLDNIEFLINKKLIEKKLIKPLYLS